MHQTVISLKQRIEENQKELYQKCGEDCQLLEATLNMLNLLVSGNVPEDTVKMYLNSMAKDITIIEDQIERIQRQKKASFL